MHGAAHRIAKGARVMGERGRTCPLAYRHGPEAVAAANILDAEVAWVVGGLYGNVEALTALLRRVERDREAGHRVRIIFNGDFHWFDRKHEDFLAIQHAVLRHDALAGNVEAELAAPHPEAGCGCAYPAFVDDAVVERSNAIMATLQETVASAPEAKRELAALPQTLRLRIAGRLVGVVHGDPESLAGWGLAVETLAANGGATNGARIADWAARAGVEAFACAHTCLPWAGVLGGIAAINNGSAGMPNFRGHLAGLASRIAPATAPAPDALYHAAAGPLRLEAIPLHYASAAWLERFTSSWPPGSPAHGSYFERITRGPAHDLARALHPGASAG